MIKTIIVGAGPAGLTAGRHLKDCLILDKKQEIGRPVQCGEGINKEALERQGIEPDPAWISAVIDVMEIIMPSGKAISIKEKEMGYVLDRSLFEKHLAKKCRVEIKLQTKVVDIERENNLWKIKTEKGEVFKSKYLIGADGPLSIVRRKVFHQKAEVLPGFEYLIRVEKELPTSVMKLYFDREKFPDGYAWVFPKSKKTANIGLGGKKNLDQRFKDLMERIVKPEFGSYELLENISGTIPWGGAKLRLYQENALLVGDAGGLTDPVLGGGMDNAMVSGEIAAKSIISDAPHLYESRIKSLPRFSSDLLVAQEILYSLPNPVLNQMAEVLEGRDLFYLKSLPGIFKLLSRHHLRKNAFRLLRLLQILDKNMVSFG